MAIYLCPPKRDAGPNDYTPSPVQDHYLNVREDPQDGDGTILSTFGASREVWELDVLAIPDGYQILSATIKTVQKDSSAGPNSFHAGFIIDGVDYFQTTHSMPDSGGAGSESYSAFVDIVLSDPSTGMPWTKARLGNILLVHEQISQPAGLPRPRVTECVVLAEAVPLPERPIGQGSAIVGSAVPGAPGTPAGTAAGLVGTAFGVAVAGDGTAAGLYPSAVMAEFGEPSATAAAVTPTAVHARVGPTAVASPVVASAAPVPLAPEAIPAAIVPPEGEAA